MVTLKPDEISLVKVIIKMLLLLFAFDEFFVKVLKFSSLDHPLVTLHTLVLPSLLFIYL